MWVDLYWPWRSASAVIFSIFLVSQCLANKFHKCFPRWRFLWVELGWTLLDWVTLTSPWLPSLPPALPAFFLHAGSCRWGQWWHWRVKNIWYMSGFILYHQLPETSSWELPPEYAIRRCHCSKCWASGFTDELFPGPWASCNLKVENGKKLCKTKN